MEPTKRELRQLKREIKRAGSQRRRREWKRELRENPEEAPFSGRISAGIPLRSSTESIRTTLGTATDRAG